MASKFAVGETVIINRLNKRTPSDIRQEIRINRKRRIIAIYYNKEQQHNIYHLGFNHRGLDLRPFDFRAEQLMKLLRRKAGRPREKRRYRVKGSKLPVSSIKG